MSKSRRSHNELNAADDEVFSIFYGRDMCPERFSSRLLSILKRRIIYESSKMPAFSGLKIVRWDHNMFLHTLRSVMLDLLLRVESYIGQSK